MENLRHTDDNYYQNIIRAINEYYQRMLYYSPNWVNNTFIYLNSMDRVIYNRAVYAPDIFSGYLLEWGDDAALWQAVCTDDNRAPFFCKLGGQDIYYGIPSSRLMSSKTGTVFFRIDSDWLEEKFSFLEQYNGYSLFVLDDDNGGVCLYSHDDLSLADSLPEDWLTAQAKGALPVLITPLVRRRFEGGTLVPTHGAYPDAVRLLAAREDLPLIDLSAASAKLVQEMGEPASRELYMVFAPNLYPNYPDGKEDNTHLRYLGAVRFTGLVAAGLYADVLLGTPERDKYDGKGYEG